jgi:hypothetical protein
MSYHYSEIGFPEVRERVRNTIGVSNGNFISFSSMGLLQKYANFFTVFKIFNVFFSSVPESYVETPGITELDRNNNVYGIHRTMGCKTIGIADDPVIRPKISNTGKGYESDIVVYRTPVKDFRENFSMGAKDFLRKYRKIQPDLRMAA